MTGIYFYSNFRTTGYSSRLIGLHNGNINMLHPLYNLLAYKEKIPGYYGMIINYRTKEIKNHFMLKTIKVFLAGIVIGILIAPDKGSRTRRRIADKISGAAEGAGNYVSEKAAAVNSTLDSAEDLLDKNLS